MAEARPILYWPRRMRIEKASSYLDMSPSAFMDRVRDGRLPHGYRDGGMRYWLIEDLDAAIDRDVAGEKPAPVEDEFTRGLERLG